MTFNKEKWEAFVIGIKVIQLSFQLIFKFHLFFFFAKQIMQIVDILEMIHGWYYMEPGTLKCRLVVCFLQSLYSYPHLNP